MTRPERLEAIRERFTKVAFGGFREGELFGLMEKLGVEDIPWLLGEVERLKKALRRVARRGDPTQGLWCGGCDWSEHSDPEHQDWCPVAEALKP